MSKSIINKCDFCGGEYKKPYIYADMEYNNELCRKCFMKELVFDEVDMKRYYDEENMRWKPIRIFKKDV